MVDAPPNQPGPVVSLPDSGRRLRRADRVRGEYKMRVFQEEIVGPVVSVTRFRDTDDALEAANDDHRHSARSDLRGLP